MNPANPSAGTQADVTARYDRIARFYDIVDRPMDLLGGVARRRRRLLARARGATLEVGVGTGRNLDVYPPDADVIGIDTSANMLVRARQRADRLGVPVSLELADVQQLPFADATFETVVATCVFCSVADPVAGLREAARVVRPGGQVLLLEHVRPQTPLLGWLFDLVNPVVRRIIGPNINRRTEDNVTQAGLDVIEVRRWGIWREIVARP
jgi:ubiquinone/menaquinone biosynthesis C-methylase UbiE